MWLIENYQSRKIHFFFLSFGLKSDLTPRSDIFIGYFARLIKLVVKTLKNLLAKTKLKRFGGLQIISRKKSNSRRAL